jgi:hypothetical protein
MGVYQYKSVVMDFLLSSIGALPLESSTTVTGTTCSFLQCVDASLLLRYSHLLVQNHNNCSIVWSSEGSDWDVVVETSRPKPDRPSRDEFRKMSQIVVHGLLVKLVGRRIDYDGRIDEIADVSGSSFQV